MIADLLLRIALAGLLGGLIGLERQLRAKEAGLRTHVLVSIGSTMFMIVSKYGFSDMLALSNVGLDPSRIAAQVVSGMGFLGAGTIMIQKQAVRGLTTAAGLWVTAAIGLVSGSGLYEIGIYGTLLALMVLELFSRLSRHFIGRHHSLLFSLKPQSVSLVLIALQRERIRTGSVSVAHSDNETGLCSMSLDIHLSRRQNISQICDNLLKIKDIKSLNVE